MCKCVVFLWNALFGPLGVTITWIASSARCCPSEQNRPLVDSAVPGCGREEAGAAFLLTGLQHTRKHLLWVPWWVHAGERPVVLCGTSKSFLLSILIYRQQQIGFFKTISLRRSVFVVLSFDKLYPESQPQVSAFLLHSYLIPSFFKNLVFLIFLNAATVGLRSGEEPHRMLMSDSCSPSGSCLAEGVCRSGQSCGGVEKQKVQSDSCLAWGLGSESFRFKMHLNSGLPWGSGYGDTSQ